MEGTVWCPEEGLAQKLPNGWSTRGKGKVYGPACQGNKKEDK